MVLPGTDASLIVNGTDGRSLYSQGHFFPPAPLLRDYTAPGEAVVYFLVDETGTYPIPRKWRKTWREHRDAIRVSE
jgi:hypothetical protein